MKGNEEEKLLKEKVCILMIFHQMRSYKQHNWYLSDDFWVISLKQKKCILVEFFIVYQGCQSL
jgi:hypothetical protein